MAMYAVEVAQPALDGMTSLAAAATDFVFPRAAWCRPPVLALTLLNGDATLWPDLLLRVLAFAEGLRQGPEGRR